MDTDDARSFLIDYLRPDRPRGGYSTYGYDIYLPYAVLAYRQEVEGNTAHEQSIRDSPKTKEISPLFFDAAWDLCRIGVIRPTVTRFGEQGTNDGTGYSLTSAGRRWLQNAESTLLSPTRMSQLFQALSDRFGAGFLQRANEAAECHFLGAYLACCAMCGAAAESILLAIAIARDGEAKALALYRTARGRQATVDRIVGQLSRAISEPFRSAVQLLSYWRDDAAHGLASTISEIEAHTALARLLKFAQFANDYWSALTGHEQP